jgi:ribose 5-phosphate isomerase B
LPTTLYILYMSPKIIAIGCDHAGFPYKDMIVAFLKKQHIQVLDFGTNSELSVDYPDFAHPTAEAVVSGAAALGILICGSGNGVAITANKHQTVRCALCWLPEIASLARQHNDANMLAIPARFISRRRTINIVKKFIATDFEGGRHANRVNKMACI